MAGWQDAPVVGNGGAAWENAPIEDNPAIPVRDIPAALGRVAKQSALPIAGQLLGTAAGLATAPITGGFALPVTAALEGAGGAGGEWLNQKLGITDPSNAQIAAQGLIPAGTRLLGALTRTAGETFPPLTKGAEFLNRNAAPEARLQLSKMTGPDAGQYFQRAIQSGAQFDTGATLSTIRSELANLKQGSNSQALYGRTINLLEGLESKLAQTGGKLDPQAYQAELRDLGASLRTAEGRTINQVEAGAVKKVYGSLAEGLNAEAGGVALPPQPWAPGQMLPAPSANARPAQDLLQARQYIKRQSVLDEIGESITKAENVLRGQGDNVQFNAASVLRDLKNNPFWNGAKGEANPAFTAPEKERITKIFTMLNELPALQPGAGINAGSMRLWQRGAAASMGGAAAGYATDNDPKAIAAGTVAGALVPTAAAFYKVVSMALRTETGQRELFNLLKKPGATMQSVFTGIAGTATAAMAQPGPAQRTPAVSTSMPAPFRQEY